MKSIKINKLTFKGVKLRGLCKVKYRLWYNDCQSYSCAVNYAMPLSKGRSANHSLPHEPDIDY